MDEITKSGIDRLGNSNPLITHKREQKLKNRFPIPKEYILLWADVRFGLRVSGLVITDQALFFLADQRSVRMWNRLVRNKKDRQQALYHKIPWPYFQADDFTFSKEDNLIVCYYQGVSIWHSRSMAFMQFIRFHKDAVSKLASVRVHDAKCSLSSFSTCRMSGKKEKNRFPFKFVSLYCGSSDVKNVLDFFDPCHTNFVGYQYDGSLVPIEVPYDRYVEYVKYLQANIQQGLVPTIKQSSKATFWVKRGRLTYRQARLLCEHHDVFALTYDHATDSVRCSHPLGITFVSSFYKSRIKGENEQESLVSALSDVLDVYDVIPVHHVKKIEQTHHVINGKPLSYVKNLMKIMGYKATQNVVHAMRSISSGAQVPAFMAARQLIRIVGSNMITAALTLVVFSIPDTVHLCQHKISIGQYVKNIVSLIAVMLCVATGTIGAVIIATNIAHSFSYALSSLQSALAGMFGGAVFGITMGTLVKILGDALFEDDIIVLTRHLNATARYLMYDYAFNEIESNTFARHLQSVTQAELKALTVLIMKNDVSTESTIHTFFKPMIDTILQSRPAVSPPSLERLHEVFDACMEQNDEQSVGQTPMIDPSLF